MAEELATGRYRVDVQIVLPNIDTRDYDFVTEICWRGAGDSELALGPLGPGPLSKCPSTADVRSDGLSVTTRCPGPNAGWASATYRKTPAGFTGRVDMNMGGKNMTLGEIQRGTFVGSCK